MYLIFVVLGAACLLYFFGVMLLIGAGPNFYYVWLFLGAGSLVFSFLLKKRIWAEQVPLWFRRIFYIIVCVGALIFLLVEICIISSFSVKGRPGLDYLVVLGAQMKTNGPSRALRYRLDEAIRYLEENADTLVVVSGGQGSDEPVSEAQGMFDYLVQNGISPERILKEDRSTNTVQNLVYSSEMMDKEIHSVGVVSNNFHVFRAVQIARSAGYQDVCGIAARGEPFLQCNNMLREFFGVVKDFLAGNM